MQPTTMKLGKGWERDAKVIPSVPTKVQGGDIYETRRYDMFVRDIRNRPIHEEKVQFFMKQFKADKFFLKEFPAVVDKDNIILDGQHRHEAVKRMELPFYFRYTDSLSIDNIVDVQVNAGWKITDYVHAFIKQKNMNYIILHRFMARYKLSASIGVTLLTGVRRGLKKSGFYDGTFKVKDETTAHDQAKVIHEIGTLLYSLHGNAAFCSAVVVAMSHPDYEHKRMLEQIKKYATIFRRQVSQLAYLRALEELYNYKAYQKNKIRFI